MDASQNQVIEKRHIATDPQVCGGKPCVSGTRIRVWDIHVWHDLHGTSPEEIVSEFPQITVADVHAALMFYHDNRELLERQDRESQRHLDELRTRYPSKVTAKSKRASDDSIPS
jgi:uncharacterized protein (DUF433 family)